MSEELKACPFCGGKAEIINIEDGENAGGSCVSCTQCLASSNVEFEFKENFVSNWNRRSAPKETGDANTIEKLEEVLLAAKEHTGQRYAPIDTEACSEYARLCDAAHNCLAESISLLPELRDALSAAEARAEAAEARVRELEVALEPFADASKELGDLEDYFHASYPGAPEGKKFKRLTLKHFRNALRTLKGATDGR